MTVKISKSAAGSSMFMTPFKYATVCSGIEAPSIAWEGLPWEPVWFSQYDPEHEYKNGPDFPSAVLKHHYPNVPNLGDMTKLNQSEVYNESKFNLLIGGTPCQSFSVAGLRAGLSDDRGNLALEFCKILIEKKPQWFIWENVPGVFSSFTGPKPPSDFQESPLGETWDSYDESDFENIIQAFMHCGYGVSWRVFDAQYFGLAQRRKRVFVVGYLGDWRPSARVLFEPESLRGDTQKSGKKRKRASSASEKGAHFDKQRIDQYGEGGILNTEREGF